MSASARVTIEPVIAEAPAKAKRRRHSITEKRQVVEESFDPRTSVARVARAHGINANQVFTWRRLYQRGQLGAGPCTAQSTELLPVKISDPPAAASTRPAVSPAAPPPVPAGTIQYRALQRAQKGIGPWGFQAATRRNRTSLASEGSLGRSTVGAKQSRRSRVALGRPKWTDRLCGGTP